MLNRKNPMKILAGILLSPALISFSGLFPSPAAQSYPEEFLVSLNFPQSPVRYGAPPRTAGGGTRGPECRKDSNDKPMALIPKNNVWTSLGARPKFLFYVPETKAEVDVEFVLIDPDGSDIYTKTLNLSSENTGTIIQETLPDDVSLAAGQPYTWQFSLICNPSSRSGDILIEGGVEQVNFEDREKLDKLKTTLEKAGEDSLKQAQAYLDAEIDNESISLLAEMRCQHQEEWQELLYWMGLEELEKYSIAKCEAEKM